MKSLFPVAALALLLAPLADAANVCPAILITGSGAADSISVTFRNLAKLPIRRLQLSCKVVTGPARKQPMSCVEKNAYFLPGSDYTSSYAYPGGAPGTVVVALDRILFNDGSSWDAAHHEPCRILRISAGKTMKTMK